MGNYFTGCSNAIIFFTPHSPELNALPIIYYLPLIWYSLFSSPIWWTFQDLVYSSTTRKKKNSIIITKENCVAIFTIRIRDDTFFSCHIWLLVYLSFTIHSIFIGCNFTWNPELKIRKCQRYKYRNILPFIQRLWEMLNRVQVSIIWFADKQHQIGQNLYQMIHLWMILWKMVSSLWRVFHYITGLYMKIINFSIWDWCVYLRFSVKCMSHFSHAGTIGKC